MRERLERIVGAERVIDDSEALGAYRDDYTEADGRDPGAVVMIETADEIVQLSNEQTRQTIADGMRAPRVGDITFSYMRHYVDDIITVGDHQHLGQLNNISLRSSKFLNSYIVPNAESVLLATGLYDCIHLLFLLRIYGSIADRSRKGPIAGRRILFERRKRVNSSAVPGGFTLTVFDH